MVSVVSVLGVVMIYLMMILMVLPPLAGQRSESEKQSVSHSMRGRVGGHQGQSEMR